MQDNYKKITQATYDEIAYDYIERDQAIVPETQEVKDALERFISLLPNSGVVLDIGSGGGRDSRFLYNHHLKVVGIDFSDKLITAAKKVEPGVDYRVMDFENLNFSNGELDGVWANASLHHIPKSNLQTVLKKIHSILKDGGIFFIKMKHGDGEGIRKNEKFGKQLKRYFAFYKTDELNKLLEAAGFEVLETALTTKEEWVESFAKK